MRQTEKFNLVQSKKGTTFFPKNGYLPYYESWDDFC